MSHGPRRSASARPGGEGFAVHRWDVLTCPICSPIGLPTPLIKDLLPYLTVCQLDELQPSLNQRGNTAQRKCPPLLLCFMVAFVIDCCCLGLRVVNSLWLDWSPAGHVWTKPCRRTCRL